MDRVLQRLYMSGDAVLSPEQAAHELVDIVHLRPRKNPNQYQNVCMPHYFEGAIPIGERWGVLVDQSCIPAISDASLTLEELLGSIGHIEVACMAGGFVSDEYPLLTFVRAAEVGLETRPHSLAIAKGDVTRLIEVTVGNVDTQGRWAADRGDFAYFQKADYWVPLMPPATEVLREHSRALRNRLDFAVSILAKAKGVGTAAWIQLCMRYSWTLVLGYERCASVSIPVERDALPDLVKLRDVPAGAKRRAALAHFVAAHYRRGRSQAPTEDPAIWIRKHLRGERVFRWDGLTCEIRPPAYEVEVMRKTAAP